MPIQFSATISYLGEEVTITSDNFADVHEAMARIAELNNDANFLAKKSGSKNLAPTYRKTGEGYEYFGVGVKGTREEVNFGKMQEGGLVPFFPKGEDGYYDGQQRSAGGRGGGNGRQQQGRAQRQQNGQQQQNQQQRQPAGQSGGGGQQEDEDGLPF